MTTLNQSYSKPSIDQSFNCKREFFDQGLTKSYEFRINALQSLKKTILKYEDEVYNALRLDLGKSKHESLLSDLGQALESINYAIKHLRAWMEPKYPLTPLILQPASSVIYRDPKGVVVIFAPWNYPFNLVMVPLAGAIAGGNCVIVKPASETPNVAAIIEKIIHEALKTEHVSVIQGEGAEIGNYLLDHFTFNHIFFTGSPNTGKIIMEKAAKNLSPVTLELGGKSPTIIDSTANVEMAAKKIVWAKYLNCGQTCIGPDYILVHEAVKNDFIQAVKKYIVQFYGSDPSLSEDYGRIVSHRRFDKIMTYIDKSDIIHGGRSDRDQKYIEPTVIQVDDLSHLCMQEEIFGPVMPIITWKTRNELLPIIRRYRYPLSTYVFSKDSEMQKYIIENVEFGTGAVNDLMVQFGNSEFEFGGIMSSGMGRYHGKASFECFTNPKPVQYSPSWFELPMLFPPYKTWKSKIASFFLK